MSPGSQMCSPRCLRPAPFFRRRSCDHRSFTYPLIWMVWGICDVCRLLGDPPSKLNSKSVSLAKDVYKKNVILLHVQARGLAIYSGSILYSSVRFRNQQTQWIALPRTWPTRTHAISTWKLKRKGKLLCSEMAKYARRASLKTTKIQTQSRSSARRHEE
mgnify:CR=1 FL=1